MPNKTFTYWCLALALIYVRLFANTCYPNFLVNTYQNENHFYLLLLWYCRYKWSNIAPYSSWILCISLICSATFSIPERASVKWFCSSLGLGAKLFSCWSSRGYFRIRWMGLIKYDSSVWACCWLGLQEAKNSWNG